jgi:hypothetical protein
MGCDLNCSIYETVLQHVLFHKIAFRTRRDTVLNLVLIDISDSVIDSIESPWLSGLTAVMTRLVDERFEFFRCETERKIALLGFILILAVHRPDRTYAARGLDAVMFAFLVCHPFS